MTRCLLFLTLFVAAQTTQAQSGDRVELGQFVKEYEAAWNTHDADVLAVFFTEDSDMLMGAEPRVVGRSKIRDWWDGYFSRIDKGRVGEFSVESMRVIAPGVAILNLNSTTKGQSVETGEILETRRARGTWVVLRQGNRWRISALRGHSPQGQTREAPGTDP
jgi:uncharacterized protein (TIGR02246 family)